MSDCLLQSRVLYIGTFNISFFVDGKRMSRESGSVKIYLQIRHIFTRSVTKLWVRKGVSTHSKVSFSNFKVGVCVAQCSPADNDTTAAAREKKTRARKKKKKKEEEEEDNEASHVR